MKKTIETSFSPYLHFSRLEWSRFRQDTPMTLSEADLNRLQGQNEPVTAQEVHDIYLPLSRLLTLYIGATEGLHKVTSQFTGKPSRKVPYIIGIAGSVAVGKSTTARLLQALLSHAPNQPKVDLVTTDGYLYPNAILEMQGLMSRKGFPESYALNNLIQFLADAKAGKPHLQVPLYSHRNYDILENQYQIVDQPDIIILEGLNVLQIGPMKSTQQARIFVSDFFDFSIYVDAKTEVIKQWFLERFTNFREKAKDDPTAFFHQFAKLSAEEALNFATHVWTEINELNLIKNILPFRERAHLILNKDEHHKVQEVLLRKL